MKLKVSDLVNFAENDYKETNRIIQVMNGLVKEYVELNNSEDLDKLESLKREFNSMMTYLATYYSKIKCFKENNTMLEGVRKEIKSQSIEYMISEADAKLTTSAAEKIVYSHPYYKERVDLLTKLKEFFYLVELQYANYEKTQMYIFQSVSLFSKERQTLINS